MKTIATVCCATAMAFLLTGCADAPPDTREADSKALKDNETQWNHDFAQRDAEKLLAHYTPDAVVMVPGVAASSGKDAIAKTLKEMVADPALTLKFHSTKVEVAKSGDMAYTQGTYTMTATAPNKKVVDDHGSYVTVYKKQADGAWKAVSDINTSEVPPLAPPEPKKKAAAHAKAKKGRR